LLQEGELPKFALVKPEHARSALETVLSGGRKRLSELEASLKKKLASSSDPLPYEAFVPQIQDLYEIVSHPWDLVQHLKATKDSPELRAIVEEMQPKVTAFSQGLSQSKPMYDAFLRLKESTSSFAALTEARQRIVQSELLNRKLGGVGLSGKQAEEFNAVQAKLAKLSQTFSNHALDARKAFNITLTAKQDVRGIPDRALVAASEAAKQAGHKDASVEQGPWLLTLDAPIMGPVMSFAENRELRENMYRSVITLASSGKTDNSGTIVEILKLRQQEAKLLGYPNYAELSFASKMATSDQVHKLLDDLLASAKEFAVSDDEELLAFAKEQGHDGDLQNWDRGFYVQRLQKTKNEIDQEELRNYFPFSSVVNGLFGLSERLFGVTAEQVVDMKDSLWNEDVTLYRLKRDGETIGYVFFDPFSRPAQKRAGGWLQPIVSRSRTAKGVRLPVGSIQANFPGPAGDKPALLSLSECDTLFHEFGHALQHILTKQDEAAVSGINGIEWDAVEIASQFMEFWIHFDRTTLYSFAKHWKSGEKLPEVVYQRLLKSHNFRAATIMTSQIYMGKVDLRLHEEYSEGEDPNAIEKSIAKKVLVVQPLPEARPLCTFSHIFNGGYAAGYYSYKWSEVLSADAFATFEAGGALQDDHRARAIGQKFAATLLGLGGGRSPGLVFKDFVGRAPSTEALLRYQGLSQGTHSESVPKKKASLVALHHSLRGQ
jgi:oligopeptidase A